MKDANNREVGKGDVVQCLPNSEMWCDGCFAVVTEARGWGIVCDVYGINNDTYPMRLASNQFVLIGRAAYVRDT